MRHSQQQNEWQLSVCKCMLGAAPTISRPIVRRIQDPGPGGGEPTRGGARSEPLKRFQNLVFKMPNRAGKATKAA